MESKFEKFIKSQLRALLEAAITGGLLIIAISTAYIISRKFGLEIEYKPNFKTVVFGLCFLILLQDQFAYRKRLKKLKRELENGVERSL